MKSKIDDEEYSQNIDYDISAENVTQIITNLIYNDKIEFFNNLYSLTDSFNFEA